MSQAATATSRQGRGLHNEGCTHSWGVTKPLGTGWRRTEAVAAELSVPKGGGLRHPIQAQVWALARLTSGGYLVGCPRAAAPGAASPAPSAPGSVHRRDGPCLRVPSPQTPPRAPGQPRCAADVPTPGRRRRAADAWRRGVWRSDFAVARGTGRSSPRACGYPPVVATPNPQTSARSVHP